jgi:hypothetical protein
MTMRLKAKIWVSAYLRRCSVENVPATIVRSGEESAGSIFIKINRLDGMCAVLAPTVGEEGVRAWLRATGDDFITEETADAYLARQLRMDPDIWIIEVEDRQGRHLLTETIRS